MLLGIFIGILGIILFLLLFWNELKEDYTSHMIFTSALLVLAGTLIGYFISRRFFLSFWFWSSFLGAFLGLSVGILIFRLKFYESFEAMTIGVMPWITFIFLSDAVKNSSVISFVYFIVMVGLIGLFYYFEKHYKLFPWYKSGRIGFAGLAIAAIFFLLRAAVASFFPYVVSFVGKSEAILSSLSAFIFFLLLFNLARKTT